MAPRRSRLPLLASAAAVAVALHGAEAHGGHTARSLGGLHDRGAAAARRRAFVEERRAAVAPAVTHGRDGDCAWAHASNGYWEACGGAAGNLGGFTALTPAAAQAWCCANATCAGFSYACDDGPACATGKGSGYFKSNVDCGFAPSSTYQGYAKPGALPVLPNVTVTITPPGPLTAAVTNVTVTFAFLSGGAPNRTSDWVGQVCAGDPIEDYLEYAPVDMFAGWATGSGSFNFTVFRSRCDYEFRYFRGKQPLWPTGSVVAASAPLTWNAGPSWATAPFHTHVAYGGEDAQHSLVVSFTTNSSAGDVTVMVGTAPGVYNLPNATDLESTTYGAADLCNAPANESSVDYWQWPGVFHHATLRGLKPGTRYYAVAVADGVAGEEVTFVTGKPLGPEVPVTFAAYGDMSVTQYVLDGDTEHDTVDGGPGAVGTSDRLRKRIDTANDIDFVLHFGDLGYAKGAVFLWDAWMSMMAAVGSRVPYMVSIGNHEYDYEYPSANDPSGVGAMWRPSWWDGLVDSLGECGVGTDFRFRAPAGGNRIFWYSFATGSATVVTLSSEHDLSPGSPQGDFLERTLAAVNRSLTPWVIVTAHREMYSLTGSEQAQQDGFRALLEPVFMRHSVDLVFNGHLHSSQRTAPTFNYTRQPAGAAPVYVISGSSGAMLEPSSITDPTDLVEFYNDRSCGFYVVSIANSTHARLQWSRNSDGAVLDDAWVVRGAAAAAGSGRGGGSSAPAA